MNLSGISDKSLVGRILRFLLWFIPPRPYSQGDLSWTQLEVGHLPGKLWPWQREGAPFL
jgi:hypothetical protein